MKLFTTSGIRRIEKNDIADRVYRNQKLMYTAARKFVNWLLPQLHQIHTIHIFSGHGNNGADGLLIAESLYIRGFSTIVYINSDQNKYSELFSSHLDRLLVIDDLNIKFLEDFRIINNPNDVIVDALLGIGINRPLTGIYKPIVGQINQSIAKVYSVDIPSGLLGQGITNHETVCANSTFSFEFPKLSFFIKENQKSLGNWTFESICIDKGVIGMSQSNHELINLRLLKYVLKERNPYSHKGTYGHTAIVAGEYGMAGAALLCGQACLSCGVGLITVYGTEANRAIYQSQLPEALFKQLPLLTYDKNLTYILGPGIDHDDLYENTLSKIIDTAVKPIVIDAGGLNYLSRNKKLLNSIPDNSILTPHPKEFSRLFGSTENTHQRLKLQIAKSKELKVIIVLKDHFTTITTPDGKTYYNTTGNAGLATGGSGDVLTGIIGSFLAQSYKPIEAATIGVFLHGYTADNYVSKYDMHTLSPSVLIDTMKEVIKELYDN